MTEVEARSLYAMGEEPTVRKPLEQDERIRELEGRLSLDSHNSSKPPSTDGYHKPAPKSRRKKMGRKPGGQKGHRGTTLALIDTPDQIIDHPVDICPCCGLDLSACITDDVERRQVHDIPPMRMIVTEHRFETKTCPLCHRVTSSADGAPPDISAPAQYGPTLVALAVYLKTYQLLPYKRSVELLRNLFGGTICEGTLANMIRKVSGSLDTSLEAIRAMLAGADVANFDETGASVKGKLQWIHVACTKLVVLFKLHARRGRDAMDAMGVLENFMGTAMHDHWKAYFTIGHGDHALCNAHHLRELTFVLDERGQSWALRMKDLLLEIKTAVDVAKAAGKKTLDPSQIANFVRRYKAVIKMGLAANPPPPPIPGKRGRVKDTKSGNLVRRLQGYMKETLAFMYNFAVPFENNLAERNLRMVKVQQKISGTFRSDAGGDNFCRIRSYIATALCNDVPVLEALTLAIAGSPFIPKTVRKSRIQGLAS
ncbi:MAG: IS66 family transposase [Terriglobia bacterium]